MVLFGQDILTYSLTFYIVCVNIFCNWFCFLLYIHPLALTPPPPFHKNGLTIICDGGQLLLNLKKKKTLLLKTLLITNWIRLVDWWRVTLTWWAHYKRHKFDLAVWQLLNKEMSTKMYVPFTNFPNVPLLRNEGEVRNWGEGRGNHIVSSWLIIHDPLTFCPFVLVVSLSWLVQ